MKILSVNDYYPPFHVGGAEVIAHNLDRAMGERGHQVHVLTTYPQEPSSLPLGVTQVSWVPRPRHRCWPMVVITDNYITPLRLARRLLRILREEHIDVIHATNGTAALAVWYASLIRRNIPSTVATLVSYIHVCPFGDLLHAQEGMACGAYGHLLRCSRLRFAGSAPGLLIPLVALFQKVNAWIFARSIGAFDEVIAISKEVEAVHVDRLELRGRCRTVYPFLTGGTRARLEPDGSQGSSSTVLFVGRMTDVKGVDVLCDAMHIVWRARPDVRLVAIGRGPRADQFEALQRSAPDGRVDLPGWVPEATLDLHYLSADLVVVPSTWREPFGLVALEALARGTPVVASRVGGLPEIVEGCGVLVEPGDPLALAEAILAALADEGLRTRASREGPRRASEVSALGPGADRIEQLYRELAAA